VPQKDEFRTRLPNSNQPRPEAEALRSPPKGADFVR
jgi:hypothetical protein